MYWCLLSLLRMYKCPFHSFSVVANGSVFVSFVELTICYIVTKFLILVYLLVNMYIHTITPSEQNPWLSPVTSSPHQCSGITQQHSSCPLFTPSTISWARPGCHPPGQGHHSQGWRDSSVWVSCHRTQGHWCGLACRWETDPASTAQLQDALWWKEMPAAAQLCTRGWQRDIHVQA